MKSMKGILIKHGRKLHRHLANDPIIVDLYLIYICVNCIVSCVVTLVTKIQNYKFNLVFTCQKPLSRGDN